MQFKHPEILYFIGFLLIPILVHLFQLQKFKKTPFTNVAFLQKIALQTRKSSRLKKWLILATRLLLLSAVIIAFSQPYFSTKKAEEKFHNFIYLDNSLSLNSNGEKGNLLQNAVKEIIENSSDKESYSLLTNFHFYKNINSEELKNTLLKLQPEANSTTIEDVLLKIKSSKSNEINTLNKVFILSDFQNNNKKNNIDFTNVNQSISFIKLISTKKNNLSIDSVFINNQNDIDISANVVIQNQGTEKKNISIALYNNEVVFAKQTFSIEENQKKTIIFPIQNQQRFHGKVNINFDDVFSFDNTFYFTLNSSKKINVLSLGSNHEFLSKIYTSNEFNFSRSTLQNINYKTVQKQDLIILNGLNELPILLTENLQKHLNEGKNLVVIPSTTIDISSYNSFFSALKIGRIQSNINDSLKITNINFKNPFFKNVFSKDVQNFQYPVVKNYYRTLFNTTSTLIDFENQQSFITKIATPKGNLFWSSSDLNIKNSNFINSPLVVPVFYNFGKLSATSPKLYYTVGETNFIDITTDLKKDEVLTIHNSSTSFIPLQQSYPEKAVLQTTDNPSANGLYTVNNRNNIIETIAFNYNKNESSIQFMNIRDLIKNNKNLHYSESITDVLKENKKNNKVTWLWKWFLALAIVSLIFEILILKFLKP